MTYEIVPWRPELEAEVVALSASVWGNDTERSLAHLRWKYLENPFLQEVLVHVALSGGAVAGMGALFGTLWELEAPPRRSLLPCVGDFIVAFEHRGRGVAQRLMSAAVGDAEHRGFPYLLSLGAIDPGGSLASGWQVAGGYQRMRRSVAARRQVPLRMVIGPRPYARAGGVAEQEFTRNVFDQLDRVAGRAAGPISVGRVPRASAMEDLVRRLPWDGRLRHVRDRRYWDWRLRDPMSEFRVLFYDHGGLQGYLVLKHSGAPDAPVCMVDWEAIDDRVRLDLLAAAVRWGQFAEMEAWVAAPDDPVVAVLREHGFEAAAGAPVSSRSVLVRRLRNVASGWHLGGRDLLDVRAWDLRQIYSA